MKIKELKRLIDSIDDEATVSVSVNVGISGGYELRSFRRIVELGRAEGLKSVVIFCDGNLTPLEEFTLDGGLYNRVYPAFEAHWKRADRDTRRKMLDRAGLQSAGIPLMRSVTQEWDELDLRVQQMTMLRCTLPEVGG